VRCSGVHRLSECQPLLRMLVSAVASDEV